MQSKIRNGLYMLMQYSFRNHCLYYRDCKWSLSWKNIAAIFSPSLYSISKRIFLIQRHELQTECYQAPTKSMLSWNRYAFNLQSLSRICFGLNNVPDKGWFNSTMNFQTGFSQLNSTLDENGNEISRVYIIYKIL